MGMSLARNSKMIDWNNLKAPSLEDVEALAWKAFQQLPEEFRSLCNDVIIRIEDFPDDETLEETQCETEFDLLGLFRGIGLEQSAPAFHTGQFPNMIWLYRRPLLDYWADHDETLGALVTHVLIHEIGHHFGLSDADMEEIERASDL